MNITRENYESYFIDLIDGTLADNLVDELLDFLRENPDLSAELKGLENITLNADKNIKYTSKPLFKTDFDKKDIFEETCIRSIENDLSEEEEAKLQHYIASNKKAKNEYQLFKATVSEPNKLIEYPAKNKLKRNKKILPYWYAYAAVLLIGFLFWFNSNNTETPINIAKVYPLNVSNVVELDMHYYKPTLAKLVEVKSTKPQEQETQKSEVTERKVEPIRLLKSNTIIASTNINYSDKLAIVPTKNTKQDIYPKLGEYLAIEVNKLNPKEKANQLAINALNKLESASNEKFQHTTNNEGKVKRIEFNSKLLAFSIPVRSE